MSPDCGEVIKSAWATQVHRSLMFQLTNCLKACRNGLVLWSKAAFGNNKKLLIEWKHKVNIIQGQEPTEENFRQQQVIKSHIDELLKMEEMLFLQRSRVNWLSYGDQNSAFFHATLT